MLRSLEVFVSGKNGDMASITIRKEKAGYTARGESCRADKDGRCVRRRESFSASALPDDWVWGIEMCGIGYWESRLLPAGDLLYHVFLDDDETGIRQVCAPAGCPEESVLLLKLMQKMFPKIRIGWLVKAFGEAAEQMIIPAGKPFEGEAEYAAVRFGSGDVNEIRIERNGKVRLRRLCYPAAENCLEERFRLDPEAAGSLLDELAGHAVCGTAEGQGMLLCLGDGKQVWCYHPGRSGAAMITGALKQYGCWPYFVKNMSGMAEN